MNELLLFIVVAVIIFGGYFLLKKVPKPAISYIKITMSVLLLGLIWWGWGVNDKHWVPQIVVTLLAISSLVREFFNLKKFYSKHGQATKKLNIEN